MNTLLKTNSLFPSTSFFDDFLTKDLSEWMNLGREGYVPRVNIVETNDDFRVEMAAPGMKKDDFQVELDNDVLTISSDNVKQEPAEGERYARREFSYHAFKRSFHLPNTVAVDKIEANYQNGLLRLTIPKKEEARKRPPKTIEIA